MTTETIKAWAPGHATLFFSTPEKRINPSENGSIGGGLNFEEGITTEIVPHGENKIYWNNQLIDGKVSLSTIKRFEEITNVTVSNVDIYHTSNIPMGHGLSTSGAGALGTSMVLDRYYETNLSKIELYEISHYADVINHTGLGSVVGQAVSGIELRLTQGGPKLCKTRKFNSNDEVVLIFYGPLSTAKVLTSENQMKLVTKAGLDVIQGISQKESLNLEEIILLGREFTKKCGLLSDRLSRKISLYGDTGEKISTMAMIGETLIIKPVKKEELIQELQKNNENYLTTKITSEEPHILF